MSDKNLSKIEKIQELNCEIMIPSKFNLYRWADEHPGTTITMAIKRIEKIFDFTSGGCLYFGFSSGKDSTISANLALLELNLRNLRAVAGIMRDGTEGVDPLDAKWVGKRLTCMQTNAEVVWSKSLEYTSRFLKRYGPQGMNLIEYSDVCLPISWQNGASFDSGVLISWDPDKGSDMWVQKMPTRESNFGFDPVTMDNRDRLNPVPVKDLKPETVKWHGDHGNIIKVRSSDLWGVDPDTGKLYSEEYAGSNEVVDAVANFGRGPWLPDAKPGAHEKEITHDFGWQFLETAWMVSDYSKK